MNKERIYILSKTYERSGTFAGTFINYKNLDTGICGSFVESILPLYEEKFEMIFDMENRWSNLSVDEQVYEAIQRMKWFIDGYFIHCIPSEMWSSIPTERIVKLYNVEMDFFKLKNMDVKFIKVSVEDEIPTREGKYIVFTKTGFGNEHVFETTVHLKGEVAHWTCNNQKVTHWLKEI